MIDMILIFLILIYQKNLKIILNKKSNFIQFWPTRAYPEKVYEDIWRMT
jgi:hypothetical protein